MKKQLVFILSIGLLTGNLLYAPHGGGGGGHFGGGGHMGGGHMGGGHAGGAHSHAAGAHHAGGSHKGGAHGAHGGHGSHGGHGGHGGNHQNNRNWNHAGGYGWGWGAGGWGRGWGWGFWGWPFWWGLWYPWPFLFIGGVAAWSVANQTNDTIVVTSDNNDYEIEPGDSQLVPKSGNNQMHIQAHYNNTGGTYTTNNTYVVAGDKGGKLVMDSDPGTQGVNENENE